jgi:hypothetical protein
MKFTHRINYILVSILFVLVCQLFVLNRSAIRNKVLSNSVPIIRTEPSGIRYSTIASSQSNFDDDNVQNLSLQSNKTHSFSFKFLIKQEDLCKFSQENTTDRVFIVFLINSHHKNFFRRKTMRDTWLQFSRFNLNSFLKPDQVAFAEKKFQIKQTDVLHIRHVFIIGQGINMDNQTIQEEASNHKDILLLDENETYQNIIQKHLALIEWAIDNCSNAHYAVKMDDDVFVNIKLLVQHLFFNQYVPKSLEPFTYCNVIEKAKPVRNKTSKWAIDTKQYSKEVYPLYCEGFAYITNINTFKIIKNQLLNKNMPFIWIDDLYVTGILLENEVNIKRIKFNYRIKRNKHFEYTLRTTYFYSWNENSLRKSIMNNINFVYRYYIFIVVHSHLTDVDVNYDQTKSSVQLFDNSVYNKKLECELNAKKLPNATLNSSACFDSSSDFNNFYFLRFFRDLWNYLNK